MNRLGAFFTCYKENIAVEYALNSLYNIYPDIKTLLVSDDGNDFSYLETKYNTLKCIIDKDTLYLNKEITDQNFREQKYQDFIKMSVKTTIQRLLKACSYCNSEYIIMMDPDTLVRGFLTIPSEAKLLGSLVNDHFPIAYKQVLKKYNALIIHRWGATPAIFHVQTFLKAVEKWNSFPSLLDDLAQSFYAIYAHDVLLPTLFALIHEKETFNSDITECYRDASWKENQKPLVHQFKEYY